MFPSIPHKYRRWQSKNFSAAFLKDFLQNENMNLLCVLFGPNYVDTFSFDSYTIILQYGTVTKTDKNYYRDNWYVTMAAQYKRNCLKLVFE